MWIKRILQNPQIPEFKDFIRKEQARKLKLDFNKLKLEVILDSQAELPFKKSLLIEWKHALVISYDWHWWHILSFDMLEDNTLFIKQIQWSKWKVSYKINTSIDSIWFYLDFFKINIVWQIDKIEVSKNPTWLENPWIFGDKDPFFRYILFQNRLNNILTNN